jgi:TetR/AcrR family transcriptional regulator, transcriptional repressor for nem operon
MRYKSSQKAETRERVVKAAERRFKQSGYSGIGVDGLAKEAGVTSGAFYGHFGSKEEVFKEAIHSGLDELYGVITDLKTQHGENWWQEFAKIYTGQKRICDLSESCALQTLTPEVGRASEDVRAVFETELLRVARLANNNTQQGATKKVTEATWASLAMLVGGVTLARAVNDQKLAAEIATAIKNAVNAMHLS